MAEYAYDPSTGQGEVVGSTAADASPAPTPEEVNESRVRQTAINLTNRSNSANSAIPGDTGNYASEGDLYQTQRELTAAQESGNHLRVAELEQKCNQLAAALVGDVFPPQQQQEEEAAPQSTADELKSVYGEDQVNETLQFAADSLSQEVSEALNEQLATDGEQAQVTYAALDTIHKNPEYLAESGAVAQFEVSVANELAEQYGKVGEVLAALNHGLATGKCSRAEAAAFVMKNPDLAQVAISAAQSGLIKLAL